MKTASITQSRTHARSASSRKWLSPRGRSVRRVAKLRCTNPSGEVGASEARVGAVSYTHLTLPTILLV
eukprot:2104712-Pyramimonas_sp.AAC.1